MTERPRLYATILRDHLRRHRQMVLVSGPRQVGKTTICRSVADAYLNWDNTDDRRTILRGPGALAAALQLDRLRDQDGRRYESWAQSIARIHRSLLAAFGREGRFDGSP